MDAMRYLLILGACVAVTLPLEFVLGARVYRRPRLLLAAVSPVALVFLAWDVLFTAQGHWWFVDRYVLGLRLLGLPLEELLFFVVIPVCALLTYEVLDGSRVRRLLRRRPAVGVERADEGRHGG